MDDVFLGVPVAAGAPPLRMSEDDLHAALLWTMEHRCQLDLAFNGFGAGEDDPLLAAADTCGRSFRWINHTFGHLDLTHSDADEVRREIAWNTEFAARHGLPVSPDCLVTGAHTGLDNPVLPQVAGECGVDWLAADASTDPRARPLGPVWLVPRHPIAVPLDVSRREQLSPLTVVGSGTATAVRTATDRLQVEAATVVMHVLSGDPRPHYSHQNALTGDRLLLDVLGTALDRVRELVRVRVRQPAMAELGRELARRVRWSQALADGTVRATVADGVLRLENTTDRAVLAPCLTPSTRRPRPTPSGCGSGWFELPAGTSTLVS